MTDRSIAFARGLAFSAAVALDLSCIGMIVAGIWSDWRWLPTAIIALIAASALGAFAKR